MVRKWLDALWEKASVEAVLIIGLTASVIALALMGKIDPGIIAQTWATVFAVYLGIKAQQ